MISKDIKKSRIGISSCCFIKSFFLVSKQVLTFGKIPNYTGELFNFRKLFFNSRGYWRRAGRIVMLIAGEYKRRCDTINIICIFMMLIIAVLILYIKYNID